MNLTPELRTFLRQHSQDDPTKLILSAARYPGVDVKWAAEQIMAHRQLKQKLPEWFANEDLIMGGRVPAEQCSSEQTARYKRQLVVGETLCDLTGGMGVDCYYMSRGLTKAIYTERQSHLCEAARNNYVALGAENIEVREGDGRELPLPDCDTIYLDPARRATDGSRVYDVEECEPNVVSWREELLRHCRRLVVKLSPMADIARVIKQLPETREIHIVAVKNECKEVIAVLEPGLSKKIEVCCIDFRTSDTLIFKYYIEEEAEAAAEHEAFDDVEMNYLYEPDVTLLKAGAFCLPVKRYGVRQFAANSHLYYSSHLVENFPGRIFCIDEIMPFASKNIKTLKNQMKQANIATRNFLLSPEELRKRTGLRDGGENYIFGTTHSAKGALLLLCRKCLILLLVAMMLIPSTAFAKRKKKTVEPTIESLVENINLPNPGLWIQGMSFVYLKSAINPTLRAEVGENPADSIDYTNTTWTFEDVVSEEDWMGQQVMSLRFKSPDGRLYRFDTGRLMSQISDTTYHPVLPGFVALEPVEKVNQALRGKDFYLMVNDERIQTADSLRLTKFTTIRIDSVTVGTEQSPLRVWFTHRQGHKASFLTSLPGSRESSTSSPLNRFLSVSDPYRNYPNIKPSDWALICDNQLRQGMTLEEVRLSWGRPQRFERMTTKSGLLERWHYQDRRVLEFRDGQLVRIAIER